MADKAMTLTTICGGAVEEKFQSALSDVTRNILDPNTDPKKKRTITIRLTLSLSKTDVGAIDVKADVTKKLEPHKAAKTSLLIDMEPGGDYVRLIEHAPGQIPGQMSIEDVSDTPPLSEEEMSVNFWKAAIDAVETGIVRIPALQRKYRLSLVQALKLIDQLEHFGIIARGDEYEDAEVLIDRDGLEEIAALHTVDLSLLETDEAESNHNKQE